MYHFPTGVKITSIKVTGAPIFSMDRIGTEDTVSTALLYENNSTGIRRELSIYKGRLLRITAIGEWADLAVATGPVPEHG